MSKSQKSRNHQLKKKRKHPLNATWNPGSDLGVEKGHSWKNEYMDMTGKMREIPIKSSLVNSNELTFISGLVILPWLCKVLTTGSGCIKLFKNKIYS